MHSVITSKIKQNSKHNDVLGIEKPLNNQHSTVYSTVAVNRTQSLVTV